MRPLAQRVALLHAEPVLLVDHHQAQVLEHHLVVLPGPVIQQGVRTDHDAGRAGGHFVQRGAAGLGPLRAGEQRHPGGLGWIVQHRAVQLTGPAERAEQLGQRPVVLLGQHLGGREQHRLAAVVHHLEHGAHRDQGLARAHLALQQPVHRVFPAERGHDLRTRRALPGGQLERELGVERVEQPAAARDAGGGGQRVLGPPSLGQHGLQHERLVPLQPQLGPVDVGELQRPVDAEQRGRLPRQAVALPDLGGQRVLRDVQRVQHGADRLGDLPGRQLAGGRIDRDDLGGVLGGQFGAGVGLAEQLAVGMDQLPLAAVAGHLAGEQAVQARLELLLPPRLAEEGQRQRAPAVGDGDLGQLAPPVAHRPGGDRLDLRQYGDVLTVPQIGQVGQLAALLVPARVMPEQLPDRVHVQRAGQDLGRAGIEHPVDLVVKPCHGLTG